MEYKYNPLWPQILIGSVLITVKAGLLMYFLIVVKSSDERRGRLDICNEIIKIEKKGKNKILIFEV